LYGPVRADTRKTTKDVPEEKTYLYPVTDLLNWIHGLFPIQVETGD